MQVFYVPVRHESTDAGSWVTVGSPPIWRSGPHANWNAGEREVTALLHRWQARSRAVGGRVWRSGSGLGVQLPDAHPAPRGGLASDSAEAMWW